MTRLGVHEALGQESYCLIQPGLPTILYSLPVSSSKLHLRTCSRESMRASLQGKNRNTRSTFPELLCSLRLRLPFSFPKSMLIYKANLNERF